MFCGAKRHLLGLGKKIVDAAIKHQTSDYSYRNLFFRNDLGRIEDVESEFLGEVFIEQLQTKFPFGKIAGLGSHSISRADENQDPRH